MNVCEVWWVHGTREECPRSPKISKELCVKDDLVQRRPFHFRHMFVWQRVIIMELRHHTEATPGPVILDGFNLVINN